MYVIIKKGWETKGTIVLGGRNISKNIIEIDKIVDSLDEVKKGEIFFKCSKRL